MNETKKSRKKTEKSCDLSRIGAASKAANSITELRRQLMPGKDVQERRSRFVPHKERQEQRHSSVPDKSAQKDRHRFVPNKERQELRHRFVPYRENRALGLGLWRLISLSGLKTALCRLSAAAPHGGRGHLRGGFASNIVKKPLRVACDTALTGPRSTRRRHGFAQAINHPEAQRATAAQ
jgi:hypothetical protein